MMVDLNQVKIRPTVATDLQRLVGMTHSVSSDYVWQVDVDKEDGQVTTSLRRVRLPRTVQVPYPRESYLLADEWNQGALTLTATVDGVPIGYTRIFEQATAGAVWVMDLVVAMDARRNGIGTLILQVVEEWALKRGHRQMFFETSNKNQPAIALVERLGYEFSGYNEHYYATQDVALFFGKSLR